MFQGGEVSEEAARIIRALAVERGAREGYEGGEEDESVDQHHRKLYRVSSAESTFMTNALLWKVEKEFLAAQEALKQDDVPKVNPNEGTRGDNPLVKKILRGAKDALKPHDRPSGGVKTPPPTSKPTPAPTPAPTPQVPSEPTWHWPTFPPIPSFPLPTPAPTGWGSGTSVTVGAVVSTAVVAGEVGALVNSTMQYAQSRIKGVTSGVPARLSVLMAAVLCPHTTCRVQVDVTGSLNGIDVDTTPLPSKGRGAGVNANVKTPVGSGGVSTYFDAGHQKSEVEANLASPTFGEGSVQFTYKPPPKQQQPQPDPLSLEHILGGRGSTAAGAGAPTASDDQQQGGRLREDLRDRVRGAMDNQ